MNFEELKKKSYSSEKKMKDKVVNLWLYYVLRPASFYPTYLALKLNISANQATLIGFIFGVISLILAFLGNLFLAAVFLNIFAVLDCVDGNLARLKKPTKLGEYLDAVSGDIVNYLFGPIFIFSSFRDGHLTQFEWLSLGSIIAIIFATTFFQILSSLANQHLKIIFKSSEAHKRDEPSSNLEILIRNGYGAAFLWPSTLIVSFLDLYHEFLIYMIVSTPLYYAITIARAFLKRT